MTQKAIPIMPENSVRRVHCTWFEVEMLLNGTFRITAFKGEGGDPFTVFEASPAIVLINNTAVPEIKAVHLIDTVDGDELPL